MFVDVIGADVCHDIQDSKIYGGRRDKSNSTVGWLASFNAALTSYHCFVSFNEKGAELMRDAYKLMKDSCEAFKHKNGHYPSTIVMYRDGMICNIMLFIY